MNEDEILQKSMKLDQVLSDGGLPSAQDLDDFLDEMRDSASEMYCRGEDLDTVFMLFRKWKKIRNSDSYPGCDPYDKSIDINTQPPVSCAALEL